MFHMGFFWWIYEPPDLGNKILTTWNVLKSGVYLTCINFWKFHDDLKACLDVIKLLSWHWQENVKFSVKMNCLGLLWDYQVKGVNISRILKFLTWHGFDEFGWNDPGINFH